MTSPSVGPHTSISTPVHTAAELLRGQIGAVGIGDQRPPAKAAAEPFAALVATTQVFPYPITKAHVMLLRWRLPAHGSSTG